MESAGLDQKEVNLHCPEEKICSQGRGPRVHKTEEKGGEGNNDGEVKKGENPKNINVE